MNAAAIAPLRWTLPVKPSEPAAGYASRLAALNGLDLTTLARASGLAVREIHVGHERGIAGVVALGGLDGEKAAALRWNTPRRPSEGPFAELKGVKLAWGTLVAANFRVCPHCIARDIADSPADVPIAARPWLRVEWLMDQIRSCPTHGVFLIETARKDCRYDVADFSKVMRAEVLPHLDRLRAEAEAAKPNAFEEWVLRRLDGKLDGANWLDGMPLHAAIWTCDGIGIEGVGDVRDRMSALSLKDWAGVSLLGYDIASAGPADIDRFLSTLVARSHAVGHVGMRSVYGLILRMLERNADDPAFDPFRDIVRSHIMDNVPLPAGAQVLGRVLKERRLHTATSAAAASGTSHITLRTIFARAGFAPALSTPGQARLTIRVDRFEHLLREFAAAVPLGDVQGETGIPKRHLADFVALGLMPTLFGSQSVRGARHRVSRAELRVFMDRLFEGALPIDRPGRNQVGIGRACFVGSTNSGELVRLIFDGKLAWKGCLRGGRRYTDLLVDADELVALLRHDAPPRRGLMVMELGAEVPGLSHAIVRALIAAGHLVVEREFCPTARRRIPVVTRESVDAFKARYVTYNELGRLRGQHPRAVRTRLDRLGRKPAFDVGEVGSWIYERADVIGEMTP